VLTITAVAVTVTLVASGVFGFTLTDPSPVPFLSNLVFYSLMVMVTTTILNVIGVRLMTFINNLGVAAEILGMLVFALILLVFFSHQPLSVLGTTAGLEAQNGGPVPIGLVAMFMALFVVYGFDTAGTFGEETIGASKQAPRGILSAIWISGVIGAIFLLAIILSTQDMAAALTDPAPIATAIKTNLGDVVGGLYLWVIFVAVSVCTLAIQGATTRLMFSMGRDRRLPAGSVWAHVSPRFKTPANAALAVGILAGVPLLVTDSPFLLAGGATGLIYISYFLCNLGVFLARTKGWPHGKAWFSLGGWGTILNLLALLWGGVMIINFALWNAPDWFGNFAAFRDLTNPLINGLLIFGSTISWLPAIPIFEATLGILLIAGIVVYAVGAKIDAVGTGVEADAATGEVAIG
jgi:amino acid transporter